MKAYPLLIVALFVSAATHAGSTSGAVIREEGSIYLEDLLVKPARLATVADAPIYYHNDLARYLGTLKKGQIVELQAVTDKAYRVRGVAQQGQVAGWVDPKYLNPLKKDFLENLKQNAVRMEQVKALIARNEVAINMTPEEVQQALGKPTKKTSRVDASGRQDVWEFIRYQSIPQETVGRDTNGNLVSTITYIKVPTGKVAITFANNLVTLFEQTEGSLEKGAQAKIVPAPFIVTY
ncbi:MAG: hypothetical protein P4L99_27125 [Chthoniobacter sp.]|nr:hypothetical protein [Chthoniobacter sp.]